MTQAAAVDVVIAVHSVSRPIRRAVESVIAASPTGRSRAIVVAHGLPPQAIADLLDGIPDDRVRIEGFSDGVPSPAGPFNHGLAVSSAPFVAVLGSDDRLESGALDAALARQGEDGSDVVILPLRHQSGERVETPLPRWRRTRRLDAVKDRLFARTAPLALMDRRLVAELTPVFDPRFATGEDLEFGSRLWLSASVSYHRGDPAYVIGADAADRVTASVDLERALAAPLALAATRWVIALPKPVRRALAVKVLRAQLLGPLDRRLRAGELLTTEADAAAATARAWLAIAPESLAPFTRAERALLDVCAAGADPTALAAAIRARDRASRLQRLLPKNPLRALDRESAVRRYALYALYRRDSRKVGP